MPRLLGESIRGGGVRRNRPPTSLGHLSQPSLLRGGARGLAGRASPLAPSAHAVADVPCPIVPWLGTGSYTEWGKPSVRCAQAEPAVPEFLLSAPRC